ncbi:MAG TPA: Coenzyme F420 hydrogenase/dehydrogenase, beta subunit C-terminal domain [Thermotogota bacterium]|nr:Coenzyme F420 hydrogenase/dehydrogenase, beta subunit C-terminal domain [Thermotogota bacterium]HRW93313.1 Coenzyme F420 hydrogenase/dehydrogenase, beta subunit C-terminal domain [Thermotogota bacterium]
MAFFPSGHKHDCTGCGACHDACPVHCIRMVRDSEGFAYPNVDESRCTHCGMCEKVCPVSTPPSRGTSSPEVFVAWNRSDPERLASSSGGLFSALAKQMFARNGVVVGAAFEEHFHLVHAIAHDVQELDALRKSKYVQSDTRGIFHRVKDLLHQGIPVLFCGTGCQVAGLRSFLGSDAPGLVSCEVICYGVPSPALFEKYLEFLAQKEGAPVSEYQFRSKHNGWNNVSVRVSFTNGKVLDFQGNRNPFYDWYERGFSMRPSCYDCFARGVERFADITIGDFWGIERFRPGTSLEKGVSAVVVNTPKGKTLLQDGRGEVLHEECPFAWLLPGNPYFVGKFPAPIDRAAFFRAFSTGGIARLLGDFFPAGTKNGD